MRQVTTDAKNAFLNREIIWERQNTKIKTRALTGTKTVLTGMFLHNNLIAISIKGDEDNDEQLIITNAGWKGNTTKERLNSLPNVSIAQKQGEWFVNGEQWNGYAILVSPDGWEYVSDKDIARYRMDLRF